MRFLSATRSQLCRVHSARSKRPGLEYLEHRLQPGSVVVSLGTLADSNLSMVEQAALGTAGVISEALSINHREMQTGASNLLGSGVRNPALETQPVGVPTKEGVEGLAATDSPFLPLPDVGGATVPVHG